MNAMLNRCTNSIAPSKRFLLSNADEDKGWQDRSALPILTSPPAFAPQDAQELKQRADELSRFQNLLRVNQQRADAAQKPDQRDLALKAAVEYKIKVEEAERQYLLFRDALFARYPRFKELRNIAPPTQSQLLSLGRRHPDTLFLQWGIVDEHKTLLVALDKTGIQTFLLPIGEKELKYLVEDWHFSLLHSSAQQDRAAREEQKARTLFQTLLASQVQTRMLAKGRYQKLVLVESGALLDVPLDALMDSTGKRLIERFAISSALSFSILNRSDSYRDPTASFLCIADPLGQKPTKEEQQVAYQRADAGPLPGARKEGQALAQFFARPRLLLGADAKEGTVRKLMGEYAFLHFATHGHLEVRDPLRSGLILAKEASGSVYDGLLTGREIVTLTLAAQMAVLSACETGRGQETSGEGLEGLVWAFQAAGCPAIVASHWKVDDTTTKELMLAFYSQLKTGKSKDAALRWAMLKVKKTQPAPYFWAAFHVIGDTKPVKMH